MTNSNLFIPVLLGTARHDRQSEKAARFMHQQVERYSLSTELVDVRDLLTMATIPAWEDGEHTAQWRKTASRADGFVMVSPEYNRGYPGELKILLDKALKEYARKPVALCGVSSGPMGGSRGVEMLRLALLGMEMVPIKPAVYFANVNELFDEAGTILDEAYAEHAATMLAELTWYAEALKAARESA